MRNTSNGKIVSLFGGPIPKPGTTMTVLLVDDQPVFRDVARAVLERDGEFSIVGEAEDGANAIEMVDRCNPDVVVMDVQMADMGGIEATRRILSAHPDANVVLMSMGGDQEYPALAREIGARGFLTKRNLNSDMLRSVLGVGPDDPAAAMAA